MNYITEIKAFCNWLVTNPLPTSAIALWYQLMAVNNSANWEKEFTVANSMLQSMTGLSRKSLHDARNKLIQKNLIKYKKGTSNQAGTYQINSFESLDCIILHTQGNTQGNAKVTHKVTPKGTGATRKAATLYYKHKHKHKQNIYHNHNICTQVINQIFEKEFGRPLTPTENQLLLSWKKVFNDDLIAEALKRAVINNAISMQYIGKILNNWEKGKVKTLDDVVKSDQEYQNNKGGTVCAGSGAGQARESNGNNFKSGGNGQNKGIDDINFAKFSFQDE